MNIKKENKFQNILFTIKNKFDKIIESYETIYSILKSNLNKNQKDFLNNIINIIIEQINIFYKIIIEKNNNKINEISQSNLSKLSEQIFQLLYVDKININYYEIKEISFNIINNNDNIQTFKKNKSNQIFRTFSHKNSEKKYKKIIRKKPNFNINNNNNYNFDNYQTLTEKKHFNILYNLYSSKKIEKKNNNNKSNSVDNKNFSKNKQNKILIKKRISNKNNENFNSKTIQNKSMKDDENFIRPTKYTKQLVRHYKETVNKFEKLHSEEQKLFKNSKMKNLKIINKKNSESSGNIFNKLKKIYKNNNDIINEKNITLNNTPNKKNNIIQNE